MCSACISSALGEWAVSQRVSKSRTANNCNIIMEMKQKKGLFFKELCNFPNSILEWTADSILRVCHKSCYAV